MYRCSASWLLRYGVAIGAVALATWLRLLLDPILGDSASFITFFPAVVLAGWYGRFGPAVLSVILSTLAAGYFFFEPRHSMAIARIQDQAALAVFVFMGMMCAWLSGSLHRARQTAAEALQQKQRLEREISRCQQVEASLHGHLRMTTILESITDGFIFFDRDWRHTYVNAAGAKMLRKTPAELLGKNLWEQWAHAAESPFGAACRRAVAENIPVQLEVYYPEPLNTWFEMRCYPSPEGLSLFFNDATERRREAEVLKEADQRKDEFLAVLGHELRNPLAPIQNVVQLLKMPGLGDEQLRWSLDVIDRQVQHVTRLVDDLLDVSRIARGKLMLKREPINLADAVTRATESCWPLIASREHTLEVVMPEHPVHVDADPTRLVQIITNLLNNAAKYTDKGGHIYLTVARANGQAVIRVCDTGIGIAPEMLSKVFDLYGQVNSSLDRAQGGLGIGLTLVRRLVEMHGGSVEANSPGPGQGSEFVVCLPALPELHETLHPRAGKSSESSGDPSAPRLEALRILVVDDDVDTAESLAMLLRPLGYELRTAYDGLAALQAAQAWRPEIVLLDIGLPRMSGLDVARRIHDDPALEDPLLVAMTGYGQEEDRRISREAGFAAHLVKPVELTALQTLLSRRTHSGRSRSVT